MDDEQLFRAAFIAIFGLTMAVSVLYRRQARRIAGAIPRRAEGAGLILLRRRWRCHSVSPSSST